MLIDNDNLDRSEQKVRLAQKIIIFLLLCGKKALKIICVMSKKKFFSPLFDILIKYEIWYYGGNFFLKKLFSLFDVGFHFSNEFHEMLVDS